MLFLCSRQCSLLWVKQLQQGHPCGSPWPTHFLRKGRLTGPTLVRNRLLEGWGWQVVSIPEYGASGIWPVDYIMAGAPQRQLVADVVAYLERE